MPVIEIRHAEVGDLNGLVRAGGQAAVLDDITGLAPSDRARLLHRMTRRAGLPAPRFA